MENKMLDMLDEHYNLEELRELCFKLKVDYDNLGGEGKRGKMRELIAYMLRQDRTQELAETVIKERPNFPWMEWVSSSVNSRYQTDPELQSSDSKKPTFWSVLFISFFLLIILIGCISVWIIFQQNQQNPKTSIPALTFTPTLETASVETFSTELALQLLYGNDVEIQITPDGKETYALRTLNELESRFYGFGSELKDGQVYTKIMGTDSLFRPSSGNTEYIVVTNTSVPPPCGDCPPVIGIAYFSNINGDWIINSNDAVIRIADKDGEFPKFEFKKIGPNIIGVLIQPLDWGQEITAQPAFLFARSPYSNEIKGLWNLAYVTATQECVQNKPCFGYESSIDFIENDEKVIYDIRVERTGTKNIYNEIVPANEVLVYQFSGDSYKLVEE